MNRGFLGRMVPRRKKAVAMRFQPQLLLLLVAPSTTWAAYDEFADEISPRNFELEARSLALVLKGEVELELHDLQGRGGPGFDSSTDTRTIGTRSPFVEIDAFWLSLRLELLDGMTFSSVLEFTPHGSTVSSVWFDARRIAPVGLEHHLEIGYHTPFVKIDRRTERYPLIGTVYWREPEFHIAYEATVHADERSHLELGLSGAFMRPITFVPVQESTSQKGTIDIVGYGRARVFSGNAPVLGAKASATASGAYLTVFGFMGQLAAEAGTDELRNNFGNYQDLPGDGAQDTAFAWWGGRIGYDGYGLHAVLEAISSRESLLRRRGGYAQLSYELQLCDAQDTDALFHTWELLVRQEIYRLSDADRVQSSGRALRSPAPSEAITWDYDVTTVALMTVVYRNLVRLRAEYYWIAETNGVAELDWPDAPIRNNELLLQLEVRF